MNKRVILMAAAICLATTTWAQSITTDSVSASDNFDFSLTEGQLDEDAEAASTVTLVSSSQDPYMNEVGFLFSPMRFKYRALDNQYVGNYFNGVKLNNVENGRFSFSGITGGLNDAVRNKEGVGVFDQNSFGFASIGGATNTNLRASKYAAGSKLGLALTNRNYVARVNYTYATGVMDNGWSFMGSIAYRWAKMGMGNIQGTFYNSFSYMIGAEKYINDKHHISLVTWGAPTERAQQGASTEEAYWLANSHYYNPYWGYQNGKKRNSRVVSEYSPSVLGTWDWFINDNTKLVTTAAATFSNYASTALGYNNAYNPRPDYYKNMPSSVLNVYSSDFNSSDFLSENPGILQQYNSLYNAWKNQYTRQVQWDLLIAQNQANNATGKSALYYVEKRHNDQTAFNLSSNLEGKFNQYGSYNLGLNINSTRGSHYKTMDDLLGANKYIDLDSYSISDYGSLSQEVQNDVDNPNRNIKEGDIFGYNYLIYVDKIKGYASNTWKFGNFVADFGADIEGTWMSRYGKMRNGRAIEYSKGSSGWAKFLGGGGKARLQYKLATSTLYVGAGIESQAPLAYNSFVAPRIQNNFVNNLKNELVTNFEVGYQWYFGPISGKVAAYMNRFDHVTQQTAFYNDDANYLTYLSMTDIKKEYKGIEAAVTIQLVRNLKLNLVGTVSDAKYTNNPLAQLAYEGSNGDIISTINNWTNPVTNKSQAMRVFMKDVRVGSTPLTALSAGLDYYINGWWLSANVNYYDRVYIDAASYCRLGKIMDKTQYYTSDVSEIDENGNVVTAFTKAQNTGGIVYDATTGEQLAVYAPSQEKFKGGFMVDASIGRSINLRNGNRINVNLQIQNITNNTNLKTGGYEQNRADKATYIFSKNSYYYYANSINAFLNISYKF